MQLGVIFSNDWELYGNGAGDYFSLQHRPLEQLLGVLEDHGAKASVFAESGQQLAHRKLAEEQPWAQEIADSWDQILQRAVSHGHDVQLHLHPQWIDARHVDGQWLLDFQMWGLANVEPQRRRAALSAGKEYLENLLSPIDPEYRCMAFRAGGFCIQPSASIVQDLSDLGIRLDSSVSTGAYAEGFYDFRKASHRHTPWRVSDDVLIESSGAGLLWEVPVAAYSSRLSPAIRKIVGKIFGKNALYRLATGAKVSQAEALWFERQAAHAAKYRPGSSLQARRRPLSPSAGNRLTNLAGKFIKRDVISLDYDALPASVIMQLIKKMVKNHSDDYLPVVLIGHTKNMSGPENLRALLPMLQREYGSALEYDTYRSCERKLDHLRSVGPNPYPDIE